MTERPAFGETAAHPDEGAKSFWIDLVVLAGGVGLIIGLADLGRTWTGELQPTFTIELNDPWVLLRCTFFSLCRGLLAYVISLAFTLLYGYWAAKDRAAGRVLIPMLDILQSIPVLSFLPGLVLGLIAAFPTNNIGLELAAVLMIFTGQAWNMTFSFYHSLRSIPNDLNETATVYRFSRWERFKWLELPYSTIGLVWNSMMSMAGGWFFLMVSESFRLGDRDFRLIGIGSYMSVAVEQGNAGAMLAALFAMVAMIVALDQLLWRPVVVWAQRFRIEEGGQGPAMTSWFLDWLRRSRIVKFLTGLFQGSATESGEAIQHRAAAPSNAGTRQNRGWLFSRILLVVLVLGLAFGGWQVVMLVRGVTMAQWLRTFEAAGWTLGRVLLAVALGTMWAVPAGLAIGLSPRLSRVLQPVVQVAASFPAPMLFPLVVAFLAWSGISLGWGSVLLMLLGTQWYILFNVVAGAMAIPADLREAMRSYRVTGWRRFWNLYVPCIFPYLVTGWITAAGGAWNASIVAEYVTVRKGDVLSTLGLGAQISIATDEGNFALLAASTLVMSAVVVLFNREVWQRLYRMAEVRFSLNK
jgi:NitT/TauT family transport system permease protein